MRQAMAHLKDSKQAVGAETLAGVQQFAPPTVLAQAARINFSTRLFNLIVTNVPGPQFPLYVLGRELLELYPIAFLPRDHALAIAVMSYNGRLDYVVKKVGGSEGAVNTQLINTRYGFGGGFFGDYTDLAVGSDNKFHALYTDSNDEQDVTWFYGLEFTATPIHQEDIVIATGP